MIIWNEKTYFSENIKEKRRGKYKKRVEKGHFIGKLYCITLPSNPENLLDIVSARELRFPHYKRQEIHVIGLAKGEDEAQETVRRIVEDMYNATSDFDVRSFFLI